ncbi:MAG: pseudouridine synthase [Pseudomonadota bacterium]
MPRTLIFNKPFGVLSQFTDSSTASSPSLTLSAFVDEPEVYPAGRLDKDSEGLMVLTSDGRLQARLSQPRFKTPKTYWVQVEGVVATEAVAALRKGVELKDGRTRPATVKPIPEPHNLWPRDPPIRVRKNIPDQWLEITITEGRNRQVRRMTAAVGHPTLRLIRARVGKWHLRDLEIGMWKDVSDEAWS